ncbi:MAG: hypothetical protein IJG09_01500 [Methanobrevibacter sp.]|nr:hypothetical protein [Methanobrevibacter sp.]
MMKKAIIILIALLLTTGVVVAKDVTDFKIPFEFSENTSDGAYIVPNGDDNPTFIILKTNDTSDIDTNETGYRIYPTGETENTYYYVDEGLGEQGCVEQIEVDGDKFLVFSTYSKGVEDKAYLGAALLSIQDFNSNNNVEPVKIF